MFRRRVPNATIARQLGTSYVTVWRWERRWKAVDPDSRKDHRYPGGTPKPRSDQRRHLVELLARRPRAYGYSTHRWTLKRVAEVMREEYSVEHTLSGVWRVLRALGFSVHFPLTRALERDGERIRH